MHILFCFLQGNMSDCCNMSVPLYNYLCCVFGYESDVKTRRLCYVISEFLSPMKGCIPSGSKAEGLDFEGSDHDIMFVQQNINVSEYPRNELLFNSFVISTTETTPGYVRLISYGKITPCVRLLCVEQDNNRLLLSNELFKQDRLFNVPLPAGVVHGPCIADPEGKVDYAFCFRCTSWIHQAHQWIHRKRAWPSTELIYEIVNYGILLVPIGCKGSPNEDIEWRVSFSVAEKQLVYSFSHTQLLCYALMKLLLKEVIDLRQDCKDLLCSYFMKTVVFWVSEEFPVHVWKPENIISCFQQVLKRLIFFMNFEILPNYFISKNNLIKNRFDPVQLLTIVNMLTELYERGIYCFHQSKTMSSFFQTNSFHWNFIRVSKMDQANSQLRIIFCNSFFKGSQLVTTLDKPLRLVNRFKLKSHRFFYSILIARISMHMSMRSIDIREFTNKNLYKRHKHNLPYFIIGLQSDAMSGWLNLATNFYWLKQYRFSLYITVNTLSKCHSNGILSLHCMDVCLNSTLSNIEHEALQHGVINASHVCKRHCTNELFFSIISCVYPLEMQKEIQMRLSCFKSPVLYGFFLRFLCLHHLDEHTEVICALQDLYGLRNYLIRMLDLLDWNIYGSSKLYAWKFQIRFTIFHNCCRTSAI